MKWKYIKLWYFIRQFSKRFAQNNKQKPIQLEKKLILLEKNLYTFEETVNYDAIKTQLECSYKHIAEQRKIRRRCQWYEDG